MPRICEANRRAQTKRPWGQGSRAKRPRGAVDVLEDHEENTTMYRKLQQAIEDSKSDTEAGNWSLVKKDFSSVAGKPARIATLAYHFPFGDHGNLGVEGLDLASAITLASCEY